MIVDCIKIVARLIKDEEDESNNNLVFELEPMYEI